MASNKMLIDASHPEETRVAVVRGNRIEEFDFESQAKKQLRGNIYLAKVTRVEPSLQAAFVEYGGNRHGFLAFSEIHPDYYQIPVADRMALLAEEAEHGEENGESEEHEKSAKGRSGANRRKSSARAQKPHEAGEEDTGDDDSTPPRTIAAAHPGENVSEPAAEEVFEPDLASEADQADAANEAEAGEKAKKPRRKRVSRKAGEIAATEEKAADEADPDPANGNGDFNQSGNGSPVVAVDEDEDTVESVGQEDALEEVPVRRKPRRQYKIQEVIKRRQIMLVQVVKEERGTKGAALTTYLSLAGRYSVLMPNTARGGGISRKITNANDRKRLKQIASELEVPKGMGVILRTAGASRTKAEIKRDFEYLMRLWENVRALTLSSTAPCLVYEEGSLIKRSIRDLYNKDISEILVAGEAGYREAKEFMRMLMPSHAKNVKLYNEEQALFSRHGVEQQLDRLLSAQVTLKSGGYLVINQTEALVSIDVNSGRSTREHSIEDTALQTNLEAADEIARQLRLRDLAGLIVIDFIDMEEKKNNRAVEKRLKDALKNDRARIQVGRISHFGLLEMSRQRIRSSMLESTMDVCPHCNGTGYIRSDSSIALHVFRSIEDHLTRHANNDLLVRCPVRIAIDILNTKRTGLIDLEKRLGVKITIAGDPSLPGQSFVLERGAASQGRAELPPRGESYVPAPPTRDDEGEEETETATTQAEGASGSSEDSEALARRKRRRGKRGGKRRRRDGVESEESESLTASGPAVEADLTDTTAEEEPQVQEAEEAAIVDHSFPAPPTEEGEAVVTESAAQELATDDAPGPLDPESAEASTVESSARAQNRSRTRRRPRNEPAEASVDTVETAEGEVEALTTEESETVETAETPAAKEESRPKRRGWWSRGGSFF